MTDRQICVLRFLAEHAVVRLNCRGALTNQVGNALTEAGLMKPRAAKCSNDCLGASAVLRSLKRKFMVDWLRNVAFDEACRKKWFITDLGIEALRKLDKS